MRDHAVESPDGVVAEPTRTRGGPAMLTESESGARNVRRPALTFKVRRRGLSDKRRAEFDEWITDWSIPMDGPLLDWADVFPAGEGMARDPARGVVLDIGFGHGESTIRMAHAEPELDVIGVEVHDPGVVTVLDAIVNDPLPHVRVMHGDVVPFLDRIAPESLRVVRIFFPDPWKKQRQHHRRLVRSDVVTALVDRMEIGGHLHLATDIVDYAELMQRVCDGESRLDGGVVERPGSRPLTRFEQRGLDEGRPPTDLIYRRTT
ncbi:MAG: tRNA (guanosine(46)-N7)-methyltransferase TrmB [Ilumatobacter sp.]|uniref:tRNA (guanosine(46)-N7)-methyltransferase TrmB n=1 Tax=Ilumatobacter sp. TaxID=1967498 RepID=UPI003298C58B